jgi:hypothetical protein
LLEEGVGGSLSKVLHLLLGEGTKDIYHRKQPYFFFKGHRHVLGASSLLRETHLIAIPLSGSPKELLGTKESARVRKGVWYVSLYRSTFCILAYGSLHLCVGKWGPSPGKGRERVVYDGAFPQRRIPCAV